MNETPTKMLSDEHQNILKVIKALSKECNSLSDGKKIDRDFFVKVIDFVRNYADKFHHIKEEDILFIELNKESSRMGCNPIEQMLYEHKEGRGFIKRIEEGVNENDKKKIIKNGRDYVDLLEEHIFKEDNVLYPMADEVLSQQDQISIMEKFKESEQDKFNEEFKNKYLTIAKNLK